MAATWNRIRLKLGVAVAAVLAVALGAATLAFAGVSLPSAAQTAFTRLGLSLPNQTSATPASGQPAGVPAATLPDQASDTAKQVLQQLQTEGGCNFGHATAQDAGATLPAQAQGACGKGGAQHAARHNRGRKSGVSHSRSDRSTGHGQSNAHQSPHGSRQTGENASGIGSSNSTSAPLGSPHTGPTVSGEVPPGPPSSTPPAATGPPSGTPGGRPSP
jgi:hypothetical protein